MMQKIRKIVSANELQDIVDNAKASAKTIGLCHGVFDLLHAGHIAHFKKAKESTDILIVSVTSQEYVNKGPGRPLFTDHERMNVISEVHCVDFIVLSESPTAIPMIQLVKPNFYFKGSDYVDEKTDLTGMIHEERQVVESLGGNICFTDEISSSSSFLISELFSIHSKDVADWLNQFKRVYSIEQVHSFLDLVSALSVNILGEIIIDKYTLLEPLAKSGKDPILVFQNLESHLFQGGALAIADNCAAWCGKVNLYSVADVDGFHSLDFQFPVASNIELSLTNTSQELMCKHRFLDRATGVKLFETYEFNPAHIYKIEAPELLANLKISSNPPLLISDYGHGIISEEIIDFLESRGDFLAVNVQLNAGNRGFNSIRKYKRLDFFTANYGELQLEYRNRELGLEKVIPSLANDLGANQALITQGERGTTFYEDGKFFHTPAFASEVRDRVGAGDSVFAIASLLAYVGSPAEIIGLISNLVAANEVKTLGHRKALTIGDIKKQVKSLMT